MQISRTRTTVDPQAVFLPAAAGVRAVVQPEGLVLLHVGNGMFYRANHVGASIWQRLAAGSCVDEVVRQVAQEFDQPAANITPDVIEFIEALVDQGFLHPRESR